MQCTLAVDGWAVTFCTARRGLGEAAARPRPLLALPNVTAHPSTATIPITVLLYNGPLLCGFNVPIKELTPTNILDLLTNFMWLTFVNESIGLYGKSVKNVCAPTYDEYYG